jgi:hypothetical protein
MSDVAKSSGKTVFNPDKIMSTSDIQKQLKSDEQIVEFFWGTDSIYAISLTDQSADVTATANVSEMDSLLSVVRNMLEGHRSYSPVHVKNYSLVTSRIYQQLFQPVINKRKVIVIPMEQILILSRQSMGKHQPEKNFKNLPI